MAGALLHHRRCEREHAVHHAEQVDVDDATPIGCARGEYGPRHRYARVVAEHVDRAEPIDHRITQGFDRRRVSHINSFRDGPRQRVGRGLRCPHVDVSDNHLMASAVQSLAHRLADARTPAGYDCYPLHLGNSMPGALLGSAGCRRTR